MHNTIISFPKSGRTWLRVMLDLSELRGKFTYDHGKIDDKGFSFVETKRQKIFNTNMLYLIRCPFDTVVSYYFQKKYREKKAEIKDIDIFALDNFDKIIQHHLVLLSMRYKFNSSCIIEYEKMKLDGLNEMRKAFNFFKADLTDSQIQDIIEECEFEKMKNFHNDRRFQGKNYRLNSKNNDENSMKVRKGKIGGYVDYLSIDTIKELNSILEKNNYYEELKKHI